MAVKFDGYNAMSVDLEDWYHVCGTPENDKTGEWHRYSSDLATSIDAILRMFDEHDIRATFFVVGYVAQQNQDLVRTISRAGHELATHGHFHRRIFDMSPAEFESDLKESVRILESIAGRKVLGYRAPEWSLKKDCRWALDLMKRSGLEYDASAGPLWHWSGKAYGLYPDEIDTAYGRILEFPVSTTRLFWERIPFSGGLPMRISPYFFIARNIDRLNRAGIPAICYLHPWEFDGEQRHIDLPVGRRFMHYFNCRSTPVKAEQLMRDFRFTTIEETLGLRNVPACPPRRKLDKPGRNKHALYRQSRSRSTLFVGAIYLFGGLAAWLMKGYAFTLIVAGITVWYWPWGRLFALIEVIGRKCAGKK